MSRPKAFLAGIYIEMEKHSGIGINIGMEINHSARYIGNTIPKSTESWLDWCFKVPRYVLHSTYSPVVVISESPD